MEQPLDVTRARSVIRRIIKEGTVTFVNPHALDAMRDDDLQQIDVLNVLRGGWVEAPEWENGAWRYKVCTQRITVVIEFECDQARASEEINELVVVTVWRVG